MGQVTTSKGEQGIIQGAFGTTGKFRVAFPSGVSPLDPNDNTLILEFKRFVYDTNKRKMLQ